MDGCFVLEMKRSDIAATNLILSNLLTVTWDSSDIANRNKDVRSQLYLHRFRLWQPAKYLSGEANLGDYS